MLASSKIKKLAQVSFIFFPDIVKLSKFQREEYAKVWFNLSLVMFGSLAIKIFQSPRPDIYTLGSFIEGLTGFLFCVNVALYIGKEQ
jgi:hypothetical protein